MFTIICKSVLLNECSLNRLEILLSVLYGCLENVFLLKNLFLLFIYKQFCNSFIDDDDDSFSVNLFEDILFTSIINLSFMAYISRRRSDTCVCLYHKINIILKMYYESL